MKTWFEVHPATVVFDGITWTLCVWSNNGDASYEANLGSKRHPVPKGLTRYVWEKAHGLPSVGYKVMAKNGNFLDYRLENLHLVHGGAEYEQLDRARRLYIQMRTVFIAEYMKIGVSHDDAWDVWLRLKDLV
jgi:hypothetical protein